MSTKGGAPTSYSDATLDTVLEDLEGVLADLYGIEMASEAVLDYCYRPGGPAYGAAPTTITPLTMPAQEPFQIAPVLPVVEDFDCQSWIDQSYAAGAQKAAGTGAWLKNLADHYYLVDTDAIIAACTLQNELAHEQGAKIADHFGRVSALMFTHWEGEAQLAFGNWFGLATGVISSLMFYADSAQLSAGAAADVIARTQELVLAQAQAGRDALDEAVGAWREDGDVFPHPPGSGYTLEQFNTFVSEHVGTYVDKIPLPGVAIGFASGEAIGEVPLLGQAIMGYQYLTEFDTRDTDPQTPESADALIGQLETAVRRICHDGDAALDQLAGKITALADEAAGADVLVLPRLPRDPRGSYDPDSHGQY